MTQTYKILKLTDEELELIKLALYREQNGYSSMANSKLEESILAKRSGDMNSETDADHKYHLYRSIANTIENIRIKISKI